MCPRRAYRSICEERKRSQSSKKLCFVGCEFLKTAWTQVFRNYNRTDKHFGKIVLKIADL